MRVGLTASVVQVLKSAGLDAVLAYPGKKMPVLKQPHFAVQLLEAVLTEYRAQVKITVLTPAASGGDVCENAAITAAQVLQDIGARCRVTGCSFDSTAGCFQCVVQADFYGYVSGGSWKPAMAVYAGNVRRNHVVSVAFWRETDKEIAVLNNAQWHFRLEELFAPGTMEEAEPPSAFTLAVQQGGRREELIGCSCTSQRRENSPEGTRQIREGVAQAYTVTAQ